MKLSATSLIAGIVAATLCFTAYSQAAANYVTSEQRAQGVERNLASMYFLEGRAAPHATLSQPTAVMRYFSS